MKSKVLKAIIIIAFIGIIAIVGIVLINNHNVEDKGYNAIVEQNKSINLEQLINNGSAVKKTYHDVSADEYADYLTKAFRQLDSGIDYYFNYLDNVTGMTRQAKDDLVKLNKEYVEQLKVAKNALAEYTSIINKPTSILTAEMINQVPARSANFIKEYATAYAKGSAYFDKLSYEVGKLISSTPYKDFTMISYEMGNVFVTKSISFIKQNMEARIAGRADQLLSASVPAQNFIRLYNRVYNGSVITPSNELVNETYYNFIKNYNKINGTKLLDDSATYLASLDDNTKAIAISVRDFLQSSSGFSLTI